MEGSDTADYGLIVPETTVAVEFHKVREQGFDVIHRVRSVLCAGQFDCLPSTPHRALGQIRARCFVALILSLSECHALQVLDGRGRRPQKSRRFLRLHFRRRSLVDMLGRLKFNGFHRLFRRELGSTAHMETQNVCEHGSLVAPRHNRIREAVL